MARMVSIEFDAHEVRVAVGASGLGSGVSLEHAVSAPLSLDSSEDALGSVKTFEAIQAILKQLGVKSGNAIVCIGRNAVELRSIVLPTVDKNELPDMVRFAAQRQFANASDSWPIDFIALPSNQDGMTDCLAATINPVIVDRINKIVESLGLTLTHIVLRPLASATMAITRQPLLASKNVLFLELFHDEADMTIVEHGNVVFMRNVRFSQPIEGAINHQSMIGEIKRTMIAAASQRTNLTIDQVMVWGSEAQYADACKALSAPLQNNVSTIDPFELIDASKSVRAEAGVITGKYSSLIGALLAPHLSERLIDFSNPRKREEKQSPVRQYAIAGVAAGVLALGAFGWYWKTHSELNAQIQELEKKIADHEKLTKDSAKKAADWRKVEAFLEGDFNWLDQLEFLSKKAAPPEKIVFGATSFSLDPKSNTATISTRFATKKQEDVPDIQEAYRDTGHSVRTTTVGFSQDKNAPLPTTADLNVRLANQKIEDPRKLVATKSPSDSKPTPSPTPEANEKPETKPSNSPDQNRTQTPDKSDKGNVTANEPLKESPKSEPSKEQDKPEPSKEPSSSSDATPSVGGASL